eukprot:2437878-Pyramimonas_sp.AAC.1
MRANEGGELFLCEGHRQVHHLSRTQFPIPPLCADGSQSYDGFLPVILNLQGFSVVLITLCGLCSTGFAGDNLRRFARVGALLQMLKIPWTTLGDFNFPPSVPEASGFLAKVGGAVIEPPSDFTCIGAGGSSLIDYAVASQSALPYILGLHVVHDVPWKPHSALPLQLRGQGEQLLTRALLLPERFPQVQRPKTEGLPGSKASRARAALVERQATARNKHAAFAQELHGDLLDKSTDAVQEEGADPARPNDTAVTGQDLLQDPE